MTTGTGQRLDPETETLIPTFGGGFDVAHTLRGEGFDASEDGTGRGAPLVPVAFSGQMSVPQVDFNLSQTLQAKNPQAVAVDLRNGSEGDITMTLQAAGMGDERGLAPNAIPHVRNAISVRRLTPRECERLQGFPDHYTAIPWRGKGADSCPDGPRYKALGNSMAVPVMRWIGVRLNQVHEIK